ncbi:DUF11 domain-containing protein [Nibribacter ruber]|uniref:DUF11 domain-containing protein n=1 Tax=Nibribacter ruber TaxID=2698458 RepID=A0A6P1P2H3_9BACT|nr:T9SS type A sorting domain-containing protein [Nibribacter ruber]QHL88609.1 DUF11 domain-containing protein [Nibribacter ruber]
MKNPLLLALLVLFLLPLTMYGEGSKQLTPNQSTAALTDPANDKAGYLAHDANFPSASGVAITSLSFLKPSGFSRNGATFSADHRLLIRVKNGERLYYGVRRAIHDQTTANQGDLTITIRRAASSTDQVGTIVQQTTLLRDQNSTRHMLLAAQPGVIGNATQVNVGPKFTINTTTYNSNGYNSLGFLNNTGADQDYWVEFEQVGESSWTDDGRRFSVYDLWDFTVVDGSGVEKPGRMRSKLWSFSAGGTSNVFSKNFNMYPLIPSEDQANAFFVKKIELAGIAPQNFFRFVTNKFGSTTAAGASYTDRRKSQTSQTDYPELFNFVNNPDISIWPSATAPEFTVGIASVCNTTTNGGKSIFTLNTTESSTFIVLINLNGVAGYQPGSADVLLESTGAKGTRTVEWNGLNGLGQAVAKGTTLNYFFRNNSAAVHFPVWDAESNVGGFRVEDVRPVAGTNYNGLLFWDDSNLPTAAFPSPQSELFGAASTTGAHTWTATSGSTTATGGDLKTVNTWTYGYTGSSTQSTTFNYDCSADVAVTNTAATAPYYIGQPFTYSVTVTNNGPIPATNIQVTDKLDATKLEFVSSSDVNYVASTGVWNVGTLAVGASKTLTITAKPLVTGSILATATQTHTEVDNVAANNSQSTSITVSPSTDIAVTNTVSAGPYYAGQAVTYTVTAKNNGPNNATSVSITDQLPAGMTISNVSATSGTYSNSTGVWTLPIAIGATQTLTITAIPTSAGTFTTTASRTAGNEYDVVSSNNSATNSITVTAAADVAVTNVITTQGPYYIGENITYTVTAINNGPVTATGVVLTDKLPTGLTFVSANPSTGTYTSSTGVWTVGTIEPGTPQTLTLVAKTTATGSYTTVASKSGQTETDLVSSNNSSTNVLTVEPTAEVAVTQTVTAGPYYNGVNATYTVTIKNNGPGAATGIVIDAGIPDGLTVVSFTAPDGTVVENRKWSIPNLASGASAVIKIIAAPNTSGTFTTTATKTAQNEIDINSANNNSNVTITALPAVDIAVTNIVSDGPYYQGEPVTYTVTATNNGPDAATGVKIKDLLSTGSFTFVSATPTAGSYDASTGIWDIATLPKGTTETLVLIAKPRVTGSITTTASRSASDQFDAVASNNSAATTINVEASGDIQVTNSVAAGPYYNGKDVTYTVVVRNNGPGTSSGVSVTDMLPAGLTLKSSSVTLGSYDPGTGLWTIGNMSSGVTQTLTLVATPTTAGTFTTTASKTSSSYDNNSDNNTAATTITVGQASNLAISNQVSEGPYFVNSNVTYTVVVTNNGPDNATGVTATDKLPTGLSFVSATATQGTYVSSTGVWTIDNLAAGSSQTLTIVAKPTTSNALTTTATVTGSLYDINTSNNTASTSISAGAALATDIQVTNTVAAGPYYVGKNITYTISARNLGPNASSGVVISDVLPAGMSFVSANPTVGTYDPTTGIWEIPTLAVNTTRTLTLVAQPTTVGDFTTTATRVSSNEQDANAANDMASNTVTVNSSADIAVVKTVTGGPTYLAGEELTFTTTVTNNGPNTASSLLISDVFSTSNFSVVSTNPEKGSYAAGEWAIGELGIGESVTLTVIAKPTKAGTLTQTASRKSATETDLVTANNTSSVVLDVDPAADIAVTNTVFSGNKYNGQPFTITVKAQNNGPSPATDVSLQDLLPEGLTYVSSTVTAGSYDNQTGIWNIGPLAIGTSAARTLTITVVPTKAGSFTNTATKVYSAEPDANTANNTVNNTFEVLPAIDIAVLNTVADGPYYVGGNAVFTITATNNGPDDATGVKVLNRYTTAAGFNVVSFTAPDGTTYTSNDGIWNIGDMPANTTKVLTVLAKINKVGTLTTSASRNASTQTDVVSSNNTSVVTLEVNPVVDIAVSNSVVAKTYYNGDEVEFTISAINNGPNSASNISLATALPNDFTFVSAAPQQGSYNASSGIWSVGDLALNGSATMKLIGKATQAGTYTLNSSYTSSTETDQNSANNSDTEEVVITGKAEVKVAMTVSSSTGTEFYRNVSLATFTVTVTNTGPDAATNLKFMDSRTGAINFTGVYPGEGVTYDPATGEGFIASLAPGESKTLVVTGYPNTTGRITLSATKLSQEGAIDLESTNNSAFASINVQAVADLAVTNIASEGPYSLGEPIIYTVTVQNKGTVDAASDVKVAYTLSKEFEFVSAKPSVGTFDATTGIWTLNRDLAPSEMQTMQVILKPVAYALLTTEAAVNSAGQFDNAMANNSQTSTISLMNPLPVTLVNFNGKAVANGVQLTWTTATEINNEKFLVERSTNGKTFQTVGEVKGAGNSSQVRNYGFLDTNSPAGTIYYRLKQVDFDGKFEHSKVISVKTKTEATKAVKLNAYPNPTTGVVNLDLSSLNNSTVTILVYSMDGRLVKTTQVQGGGNQQVDLGSLAVGTYLLKVSTPEVTIMKRIVKH